MTQDKAQRKIEEMMDAIGPIAVLKRLESLCPSDATACSADGEAALGEAMQDLWNDRCVDCGEIPTCFEVHGPRTTRITADFEGSAFVRDIVATLKSRGYSILPNAPAMARRAGDRNQIDG